MEDMEKQRFLRAVTAANELVIAAEIGGAPASVVLHGRPAELVRLRQLTLHARARAEERES